MDAKFVPMYEMMKKETVEFKARLKKMIKEETICTGFLKTVHECYNDNGVVGEFTVLWKASLDFGIASPGIVPRKDLNGFFMVQCPRTDKHLLVTNFFTKGVKVEKISMGYKCFKDEPGIVPYLIGIDRDENYENLEFSEKGHDWIFIMKDASTTDFSISPDSLGNSIPYFLFDEKNFLYEKSRQKALKTIMENYPIIGSDVTSWKSQYNVTFSFEETKKHFRYEWVKKNKPDLDSLVPEWNDRNEEWFDILVVQAHNLIGQEEANFENKE